MNKTIKILVHVVYVYQSRTITTAHHVMYNYPYLHFIINSIEWVHIHIHSLITSNFSMSSFSYVNYNSLNSSCEMLFIFSTENFLCQSAIHISNTFLILWFGIIFHHLGFLVFLQTLPCMPELENELRVVFISQPSLPSGGLSSVNSEHGDCIIKPLLTHNLGNISTHKPKSAVELFGISLPLLLVSLLLFYGIPFFSPLSYDVLLLSFPNF